MADVVSRHRDFDIVLVDNSSRLSKSLRDFRDLDQRFAHYGVRVGAAVTSSLEDIPGLPAKAREFATTEMSRLVNAIRLSRSEGGDIALDGEWNLPGGNRGPVLVAGARFELATFGL